MHVEIKNTDSNLTAYLLLLAMGIHGIFAGLAFGISEKSSEVITMFLAMIAHKWSEALTVGISFVMAELPNRKAVSLIVFLACMTPLGILIGYFLSGLNPIITGVGMSLSAGTFLYISCAEILVEEFALAKNKFYKFLAYSLGIAFVIMLGFLE